MTPQDLLQHSDTGHLWLSTVSKFDSPMFKYGDGRTASSADVVDSDVAHCL